MKEEELAVFVGEPHPFLSRNTNKGIASIVGAVQNVIGNWDHIMDGGNLFDKFEKAWAYGEAGALGGEASLYAGPEAGFAVAGSLNLVVDNHYGYANGWSWKSVVNGGMSALGAGEAGIDAAEKAGYKLAEKEAFEQAENASKGLLEKWSVTGKFFDDAHIGNFKVGDYLHDGLKAGRDATLNAYKDSDDFSLGDAGRSFAVGFGANAIGTYAGKNFKNISNKTTQKLASKYVETISFQNANQIIMGKDFDMADFFSDASSTLISTLAGRLFPFRGSSDITEGTSHESPGGELYWLFHYR